MAKRRGYSIGEQIVPVAPTTISYLRRRFSAPDYLDLVVQY